MAEETKEINKKDTDTPKGIEHTRSKRLYTPDVDIIERRDDIVVMADMPGVDENSVDVTLENNVLTIYGKIDTEIPEKHELYISEYGIGDYQRIFNINEEIDRDKIEALVKNGVLKIILPKSEALKTKKIEVKTEAAEA
jgi:HSP20 family molecular chaperone IbpA